MKLISNKYKHKKLKGGLWGTACAIVDSLNFPLYGTFSLGDITTWAKYVFYKEIMRQRHFSQ
jgi:hypothetical protein